jgi:FMN phosphatase YigB (HAD superfamily)
MSTPNDPDKRLHALMDALAERELSLSDSEVLDDALAEGVDVKAEASEVRNVLLAGIQHARKRRLEAAKAAHEKAVASIKAAAFQLPKEPAARRALLSRVVQRRPEMREALVTLQHRNFESLSDGDVESALRQLQHLGILNDDPEHKK